MLHYFLLLQHIALCADTTTNSPAKSRRSLQNTLATAFLRDINPHFIAYLTQEERSDTWQIDDVCALVPYKFENRVFVVRCAKKRWTEVSVHALLDHKGESGYLQLRPQFLPQSIAHLHITSSKQKYAYDLRHLPSAARTVSFDANYLYGSLDFQCLPVDLYSLNLSRNNFSGRIALLHLPWRLSEIDLSYNTLSQRELFFQDVPEALTALYLHETGIQSIRPLHRNSEEKRRLSSITFGLAKKEKV